MKWIVLTPEQAVKYRQYKMTPWWGIDPIQTKDGRWVLREDQIGELEGFKMEQKITLQKFEDNDLDLIADFKTIRNIIELTKADFPEPEIELVETPIIPKKS